MNLLSFFKRRPRPVTALKLEAYPQTGIEYRAIAENRNVANRIFAMPEFQAMYGTLIADRPSKLLSIGLPMHVNASHAMYCRGYEQCLEQLLLLGVELRVAPEQPMTFAED